MEKDQNLKICPNCGIRRLHPDISKNGVSKMDGATIICLTCAREQDFQEVLAQIGSGRHSER